MREFQDKPAGETQERYDHVRGLLNSYEILRETNHRHGRSLIEFIKSFKGIVIALNQIIDTGCSQEIFEILKVRQETLHDDIYRKVSEFDNRFIIVVTNIIKTVKPIAKAMKERLYAQIDYQKYSQEYSKLKVKPNLTSKEYRRLYEVESKSKESKTNLDSLNQCIDIELSLIIKLNEQIANKLGTMVYLFVCDLYKALWESIRDVEKHCYPTEIGSNSQYAMIFYQKVVNDFKTKREGVNEKVEQIGLLNFRLRSINAMVERSTIGTALYDFNGSKPEDLKFQKGETVTIVLKKDSGWWIARKANGEEGEIPFNYFSYC